MQDMLEFMSDKAKLLLLIKEKSIEVEGRQICCLSQQNIANKAHCGKLRINTYIRELISGGYVETINQKGKYAVTEKGQEVLSRFLQEKV